MKIIGLRIRRLGVRVHGGGGGGGGGSGGGSTVGSVTGSGLKGVFNSARDNTVGAIKGLYEQGKASHQSGQTLTAAVQNGDMTLWEALKVTVGVGLQGLEHQLVGGG